MQPLEAELPLESQAPDTSFYVVLADAVLVVHFAFVLFVVAGLLVVVLGGWLRWAWIRNSWFRLLHLVGIAVVVVQAWFGIICPLTTLEMWLRRSAGASSYQGSFIQYWLHELLFYQASGWVFALVYSGFGLLVLVALFVYPPDFLKRSRW